MSTTTTTTERSGRSRLVRSVTVLAALLAVAVLTVEGSRAAFSATTSNGVNNFAAGTVVIADDDSGSVMFNLTGMVPGTTATKCINVTYTGTVTANVKLYGAVAGSGLADYLTTDIDVGTGATGGATFSCASFTETNANVVNNTMTWFGTNHSNYGNGMGTGFASATNPTTRSYRVQVTLADNNLAQGKTATATFTWEAQNV